MDLSLRAKIFLYAILCLFLICLALQVLRQPWLAGQLREKGREYLSSTLSLGQQIAKDHAEDSWRELADNIAKLSGYRARRLSIW